MPALKRVFPSGSDEYILKCYKDHGMFIEEIASILGTSRRKVSAILVANGVNLKARIGQKRKDRCIDLESLTIEGQAFTFQPVAPKEQVMGMAIITEGMRSRIRSLAKTKRIKDRAAEYGNHVAIEIAYEVPGISSDTIAGILAGVNS